MSRINECYEFMEDEDYTLDDFFNSFPTMHFSFGDVPTSPAVYELKGSDYMYKDENGYYCVGIMRLGYNEFCF